MDGAGALLATEIQAGMGAALDRDFSNVRVHTDEKSARAAEQLEARAFTAGDHIGFAAGEYQPDTPFGQALLAHELAHVAQQHGHDQSGGTHPPQRAALAEPDTDVAREREADTSAAHAVLSLLGKAKQTVSRMSAEALPRLRTGLRVQRCAKPTLSSALSTAKAERVELHSSHPMTAFGDPRVNPVWTPGSADHAVAYTKGASPEVSARFQLGTGLPTGPAPAVSIRVKEGGAVRATKAGITPAPTVDVAGLVLSGLTGSTEIRSSSYTLNWEASVDGTTWVPVASTGAHPVHWLHGTPLEAPLRSLAVSKAAGYAAGASSAATAAAAIRHGLRGVDHLDYKPNDPINADPLTVFADGVGICTDYGNLLVLLARSVGLTANAVMFFGGFQSLGKPVWAAVDTSYINLIKVHSPVPSYNPPGSPAGWSFNYHVIARIDGVLQDAALDRDGIEAEAVHAGKIVHLVELAGVALPSAKKGVSYSQTVARKDHVVAVTVRDYGPQITTADFNEVIALNIPPGASSPIDIPVHWSVTGGSLPGGLALDPLTGEIHGKPLAKGTSSFTIDASGPPLTSSATLTLVVTK